MRPRSVAAQRARTASPGAASVRLPFKPLDTARLAGDHRPRVWVAITKTRPFRLVDAMNTAALMRRLG